MCVTGGEPLAQAQCFDLLIRLCDRVVDVKTPGSGEVERTCGENLALLRAQRDAVKIVICDTADYEWTRNELAERIRVACPIFFFPSYGKLDARTLAEWVLDDQLAVRLQVQLHKVLWRDVPGR